MKKFNLFICLVYKIQVGCSEKSDTVLFGATFHKVFSQWNLGSASMMTDERSGRKFFHIAKCSIVSVFKETYGKELIH